MLHEENALLRSSLERQAHLSSKQKEDKTKLAPSSQAL